MSLSIWSNDVVKVDERVESPWMGTVIRARRRKDEASLCALLESREVSGGATVRGEAARVLGLLGTTSAAPRISRMLAEDTDVESRAKAANALGPMRASEATPVLIGALDDSALRVRSEAARALGEISDERATAALISCLEDPHYRVREMAAEALGVIGAPTALDPLVEVFNRDRLKVRLFALEAIGRIGGEDAATVLQELRRRTRNPWMRRLMTVKLNRIRLNTQD